MAAVLLSNFAEIVSFSVTHVLTAHCYIRNICHDFFEREHGLYIAKRVSAVMYHLKLERQIVLGIWPPIALAIEILLNGPADPAILVYELTQGGPESSAADFRALRVQRTTL